MKNILNPEFKKLSIQELKDLNLIVKETIAFGLNSPAKSTFTVANLWNIQKNFGQRSKRKYF